MLALVVACAGCTQEAKPAAIKDAPPPVVVVQKVAEEEIHEFDEYQGRIQAKESVDVRARVRGHLVEVNFTDGQIVKAGEVLLRIDPRTYKATYDQAVARRTAAQASQALAIADLDRTKQLFAKQVATQQDMDTALAKKAVADADVIKGDADVEAEKLNVDFCTIKAEIDGRVSRAIVTKGNLINSLGGETLLTTIVSIDPIEVYFDVDEIAMQRYASSARAAGIERLENIREAKIPVRIALGTDKDFPHEGIVDFVDNKVDPSTGTILARGLLPNKDGALLPGFYAKVRVSGRASVFQGVRVPDRAIATDLGVKYVLVVKDDNVVERRTVELGRMQDGQRVIKSGLKGGEHVIVSGLQRARPGSKVSPQENKTENSPPLGKGGQGG